MAVSQFPSRPNVAFPGDPVGDIHMICQDLPALPEVSVATFKDAGRSYGMEAPTAITLRWLLIYDGQSAAEAAVLDAHNAEAFNNLLGFAFRHPRTNILYTGVHYESYIYPQHEHLNCQRREITLIKSPA